MNPPPLSSSFPTDSLFTEFLLSRPTHARLYTYMYTHAHRDELHYLCHRIVQIFKTTTECKYMGGIGAGTRVCVCLRAWPLKRNE